MNILELASLAVEKEILRLCVECAQQKTLSVGYKNYFFESAKKRIEEINKLIGNHEEEIKQIKLEDVYKYELQKFKNK